MDEELILFNKDAQRSLFSEKKFTSWDECEKFLVEWSKLQGFHIIKDHVRRDEGVIRHRTFICSHGRAYQSHSTKNTTTKKLNCPFLLMFHVLKPKILKL